MVSRSQINEPGVEPCAPGDGRPAAKEALRHIPELIEHLREQASYYAGVRKDLASAKAREKMGKGAFGAVAGVAGASVVFTSVFLILWGAARGLTWLFGGWEGLAYALLGVVVLGATLLGTWLGVKHWRHKNMASTQHKYEQLKQEYARQEMPQQRPARASQIG